MERGLSTLAKIATRRRLGTTSRKISIRLPASSSDRTDMPVTLPPGRARLATMPLATGSPTLAKTIGMSDVACFAARTCGVPEVTMTSTLSRTNSAAIWAKRSARPSDQRYSIVIVRPSIHPSSRSRCTKAATHSLAAERVLWPKKPMVGSFAGCCARAASGQAAADPAIALMKSRRRIALPEAGTTPRRKRLQQGFTTGGMGSDGHLRSNNPQHRMSALGQKRTSPSTTQMSAKCQVPPKCGAAKRRSRTRSSHHGGTPTVDIDRCAGDVAALLRRQQAGEIGKFLRLAGATERNLLAVRLVVLLERHVGPFRPLHMLVGANDADEHGIH